MPRKRKSAAAPATPIKLESTAVIPPLVEKEEQVNIQTLVNLVCAYTAYSKNQAQNLISGVLSRTESNLVGDVIDWCIHVKELETQQEIAAQVALGLALVEKIDGKWILIDRVERS